AVDLHQPARRESAAILDVPRLNCAHTPGLVLVAFEQVPYRFVEARNPDIALLQCIERCTPDADPLPGVPCGLRHGEPIGRESSEDVLLEVAVQLAGIGKVAPGCLRRDGRMRPR